MPFPDSSAYWELHFWRPYQPILREEESERKKHQTLHRILEEEYHPVCQCRRFRVDVIAALKGRTVTRTREEKVMTRVSLLQRITPILRRSRKTKLSEIPDEFERQESSNGIRKSPALAGSERIFTCTRLMTYRAGAPDAAGNPR